MSNLKYPLFADYDGSPVVIVADGLIGYLYGGDGEWHDADRHAVWHAKLFRDRPEFDRRFPGLPLLKL